MGLTLRQINKNEHSSKSSVIVEFTFEKDMREVAGKRISIYHCYTSDLLMAKVSVKLKTTRVDGGNLFIGQ